MFSVFHRQCRSSFSRMKPFLSSSFSSSSDLTRENRISLYCPSLLPLQTCQSLRQLFQIQAHLITSGLFQDPFPASRVLKFCAGSGDTDYTVLVFRHIDSPDTFCFNTVIKAYSCSSIPHQAIGFYFLNLRDGLLPNSYTFVYLLRCCAKVVHCSGVGEKCHGQVVKNGVDKVMPVQNCLIHMYSSFGRVDCAWRVFDGMCDRDLVSWNSMVDGFARVGDLVGARRMFDIMPERNVISWNTMIDGYLKCGSPGCALKLFREMERMGLRGSDTTMVIVLTACGRSARLKEGRSVHGSLIRSFMQSSLILDTALIDMYSKCQRVEHARTVFDGMSERNLVSWNAMILGHCTHGCPQDGLNLFADMVGTVGPRDRYSEYNCSLIGKRVLPDEVTFIGVLCACARAGLLSEGKDFFNMMTGVYGIKPKFAHYWCLANLYASVELVQKAEEILRSIMLEDCEDELSYSSIWSGFLGACRFRGDADWGERIAKRLIELEPQNASRYTLLLNIYAVMNRWEDVAKVKEMIKERGFGRMPGCSLFDLTELVYKFKLGDRSQEGMEEVFTMMEELAQRLRLCGTNSPPVGAESTDNKK
ncbi:PREDICTED: pentatricopeptide repeat-containing protein At3g51320 [Nelumbo nucifera]|uniref:Pentatricopeptide repeat-containing protein At3g51320 n=2 Tax=Nelumbo nucifera TaxID=4432 RepID=A0A1U7ZRP3_NELNU|nr:PREDICTED: pentatricopeptide repeat-containing protein At3g51320 [Nelumbo nucifera]XP_010251445.1 PREDICTED: pentatricopeptide repeat-containing protein At3g51320 [Nelumbo nucifera]XP_010251446.1 PREDICTED: pentatricopeptide repeat-containing protein At3g51320 [Nelumbo nucifera]XP_010251447.1 PREDICTED: pentatricopeptide repeat-containing protein At3g51320 [Nelumbo nucifera]DAD43320.1 TPA_asm: hypothetical protein HUJ06_001550 [Nelumbo nucifera]